MNETDYLTIEETNGTQGDTQGSYMPPDPYPTLRLLVYQLNHYFIPVIIVLGIIGNIFALVVFLGTYMRRRSVSLYLAALAVSDTTFLLTLTVLWLEYVEVKIFHTNGFCQLTIYLTYCSSFLSVWFVVSFTVERYIAVCHPLRRPAMCTVGRAQRVVIGLTVACLLAYSVTLWTSGIDEISGVNGDKFFVCTPLSKYMFVHTIYTYADTLFTLLMPFLAILVLNIKIAHKIAYFYYKHKRRQVVILNLQQKYDTTTNPTTGSSSGSQEKNASSSYQAEHIVPSHSNQPYTNSVSLCSKAQLQVTRMLLILSSLFMLINLPSYVMRMRIFINSFRHQQLTHKEHHFQMLLQQIFQLIYYTNFAMNFVLYMVCSSKFRQAFHRFWKQVWHRVSMIYRFCYYCCYCDGEALDYDDHVHNNETRR